MEMKNKKEGNTMITFDFENGTIKRFKSLSCALEFTHENNTRIIRRY